MALSELLLLSGNDIPFPEMQIMIHQPTLKEIALIGEDTFFEGCEFLRFSKENLIQQDKINLSSKTNFEVLMMILNDRNSEVGIKIDKVLMMLAIIFPGYECQILKDKIVLIKDELTYSINNQNYESFKNIITEMFCFNSLASATKQDYNPVDALAESIANQLMKGRQKAAAAAPKKKKKISILGRYVSILTVASNKSMREMMLYTIPQIFDEFNRYQLKRAYDMNMSARMAGPTKLDDPDDWTKDLYE